MEKRLKKLGILILMLILFPQQGQAVELDNIENIQPLFTNINTFQSTLDIDSNGKSSNTVYLRRLKLTHIYNNIKGEDGQQSKVGQNPETQLVMVLLIIGM